MTQQLDLLNQDIQTWSIDLYIDLATAVWLCHDYLLTLPKERRCIWRRQVSAVTIVFLVTRYVTLFKQALKFAQFIAWHKYSASGVPACNLVMTLDAIVTAVLYANVTVFSSLRIYAISGRKVKLTAIVFGLGMVHAWSNLYKNSVGTFKPLPAPFSGCAHYVVPSEDISAALGENQPVTTPYRIATYLGTGCIIISELIAQVYTWERTLSIHRTLKSHSVHKPLYVLLLRDGAISYLILSIWSILTLVVTRISISNMALPGVSVLLCRFVLSLRQVNLADRGPSNSVISRVVGNAGAPLDLELHAGLADHGSSEEEEDVVYTTDDPLMAGLEHHIGNKPCLADYAPTV